jgi:hypothetical protein
MAPSVPGRVSHRMNVPQGCASSASASSTWSPRPTRALRPRHECKPGQHHAPRSSGRGAKRKGTRPRRLLHGPRTRRGAAADVDLVFIGALTEAACSLTLSNLFSRGAVTVLGGPHARCYPGGRPEAFDYVVGFTDRAVVGEVPRDRSPHRPSAHLTAQRAARGAPLRERWKFIEPTLKARSFKHVPMIGSLTSLHPALHRFVVPYQPLLIRRPSEDRRFGNLRSGRTWAGTTRTSGSDSTTT